MWYDFYFLFRIPQLNVIEALQGPAKKKICDPYGYIQEPPLCNKYTKSVTFGK